MQACAAGVVCACTWVPVVFYERAVGQPTRVYATCTNPKCGNHGQRFALPLTPLLQQPGRVHARPGSGPADPGPATLGTKT